MSDACATIPLGFEQAGRLWLRAGEVSQSNDCFITRIVYSTLYGALSSASLALNATTIIPMTVISLIYRYCEGTVGLCEGLAEIFHETYRVFALMLTSIFALTLIALGIFWPSGAYRLIDVEKRAPVELADVTEDLLELMRSYPERIDVSEFINNAINEKLDEAPFEFEGFGTLSFRIKAYVSILLQHDGETDFDDFAINNLDQFAFLDIDEAQETFLMNLGKELVSEVREYEERIEREIESELRELARRQNRPAHPSATVV